MAVTREALFEEVWAEPMTKVAARHGVSSNFLARVYERLNIPHPGRGYWQQLEVGKADPRPALPERISASVSSLARSGVRRATPAKAVEARRVEVARVMLEEAPIPSKKWRMR